MSGGTRWLRLAGRALAVLLGAVALVFGFFALAWTELAQAGVAAGAALGAAGVWKLTGTGTA